MVRRNRRQTRCKECSQGIRGLVFLLIVAAVIQATATDYFVDFATGSDTNEGTISAPWKRSPGDPMASANAARVLLAGDVVHFKGGIVYYGTVKISDSGTSGRPIAFDGNSTGGWGNGRAILDGANTNTLAFGSTGDVSFVHIRNYEIRNFGGFSDDNPILSKSCSEVALASAPEGAGITLTGSDLLLQNLLVHRIGQWRNQQPFSAGAINGTGISLENARRVRIEDCELTKMHTGISLKAKAPEGLIEDVTVDRCQLHNYMVWCIDVAPRSEGVTLRDLTIRDCKIYDYHEFDSGNWLGCGSKPHTDGIFLRTAGMPSQWERVNIFNNEFFADNAGASQGGTAAIYISQGASANVYNNSFVNVRHSRSIGVSHAVVGTNLQVVQIYNNTFLNSPAIILDGETNVGKRIVRIKNNVFCNSGSRATAVFLNINGALPTEINNNLYWNPNINSISYSVAYWYGTWAKLSELQSKGFEKNGYYADPRLTMINKGIPSESNLRLLSGSAAVQKGANLYSLFTADKNGQQRSAVGAWDVGAYSFVSDGRPAPPWLKLR